METIAHEKSSDKNTVKNLGSVTSEDVADLRRMASEASELGTGSRPFMEPKAKTEGLKKETRGRKSNAEKARIEAEKQAPQGQGVNPQPQAPLGAPGKDVMRPVFQVISGLLPRLTSVPATKLSDEEVEQLAITWGAVADKYLPGIINEHGVLIAAIGVTAVVGWRISEELEKEIQARKKAQKNKDEKNVTPLNKEPETKAPPHHEPKLPDIHI
jgi:hypothetical protein